MWVKNVVTHPLGARATGQAGHGKFDYVHLHSTAGQELGCEATGQCTRVGKAQSEVPSDLPKLISDSWVQ